MSDFDTWGRALGWWLSAVIIGVCVGLILRKDNHA